MPVAMLCCAVLCYAMLCYAMLCHEQARLERPGLLRKARVAAGFSLGEYTALVFGGALSFEDGLRLVKIRAEAMEAAASGGAGGMASVAGVSDAVLREALDKANAHAGPGKHAYAQREPNSQSPDLPALCVCAACPAFGSGD